MGMFLTHVGQPELKRYKQLGISAIEAVIRKLLNNEKSTLRFTDKSYQTCNFLILLSRTEGVVITHIDVQDRYLSSFSIPTM